MNHEYNIELTARDPYAVQPTRILPKLKPHQLSALKKAQQMETTGDVSYNVPNPSMYIGDSYARRRIMFNNQFTVSTNIGVLGDIVGYGKTLTALSIIAATPAPQIRRVQQDVFSFYHHGYTNLVVSRKHEPVSSADMFIGTTLIVVPRGPVYVQWENAIRQQTQLNVLCIDSLHTIRKHLPGTGSTFSHIKEYFERYDAVLIKATTLKVLMEYYDMPYHQHPIQAWDRIMIDEAHDIINNIPVFSFHFLWLISGTYQSLLGRVYGSRTHMTFAVREIFDEERMNLVLVKGERAFVQQSFQIPAPIEHYYLCEIPRALSAIHPFLHPSIQQKINANDIEGAIRELGGKHETEQDIVQLVTRELEREYNNKQREIAYTESLEIAPEVRQQRIQTLRQELQRCQEKMENLKQRLTCLDQKTCPICYDTFNNPIMLPCTHVFCGGCLLKWMQNGNACPECRSVITVKKLTAIVKNKSDPTSSGMVVPQILSKEDTLFKLLEERPDGRFLIFSQSDFTFTRIIMRMSNMGISHAEIKGSTSTMMRILEQFRNNEIKVILLNTYHAGSGIDMSCATDVVIFHSMGLDKMQAVGRAQRVGRTTPLHIHNLCYPDEMSEVSTAAST
jgi:SNF2 family DNA or RNA helicase